MAIGYRVTNERELVDIQSRMIEMVHEKSGARIVAIQNDDPNKVFSITFRTPPWDSTGLPHILEHSVLCGSRKYPVKEPFVELVKGSLNTFLNAMTFSDKTMYPIASCNDKDFRNLMDVYLDAVFYPSIYDKPEIFLQEGWHYECEGLDQPITYNGVVYNEMKGAFSSPDSVLYRKIEQVLFPETAYGFESGGDPEVIPQLTYAQFLEFHKTYYHPSNSFIYLYGDLDLDDTLNYMDQAYLDDFDAIDVDSALREQPAFEAPVRLEDEYPIGDTESPEQKTFLSHNLVVGKADDPKKAMAFSILEYMLLNMQGAPLKQALLDAGIGEDVSGSYDNRAYQPYLSIVIKNADPSKEALFHQVLTDTLETMIAEGLDRESIEAAINYYEFKAREADYGTYPKGLIYNLMVFDSWLYDEDPAAYLAFDSLFGFLREAMTTHYYEDLLKEAFFNNTHQATVVLRPKQGLTSEKEAQVAEALSAYKATLTETEILDLMARAEALKAYQDREDRAEDLATLPLLELSDIAPEAEVPHYNAALKEDVTVFKTHVFTNAIGYVNYSFNLPAIHSEELPYLSLLSYMLGKLSTKQSHYTVLAKRINLNTGGLRANLNLFTPIGKRQELNLRLDVKSKAFMAMQPTMFDLLKEVMTETVFDDWSRMKDLIAELKSRLQSMIPASGHASAVTRAKAQFSLTSRAYELANGIDYYHFIESLDRDFDFKKEALKDRLESLFETVFNKKELLIAITATPADQSGMEELALEAVKGMPSATVEKTCQLKLLKHTEAFKTPGKVQYVAKCGNFSEKGMAYSARLEVLQGLLAYSYLWNQVRVKGGAYGAMLNFNRNGDMSVVSYRDPNLRQTIETFEAMADYVEGLELDERELRKNIIGTFSGFDVPLTPALQGEKALSMYLTGLTAVILNEERQEVLTMKPSDLKVFGRYIRECMSQNHLCVIGNENKIHEDRTLFEEIKPLIH